MKTSALIVLLALVAFGCTAPVADVPTPTPYMQPAFRLSWCQPTALGFFVQWLTAAS